MTHRLIPLCLALGLVGAAYAASPEKSSVAYPTGYRKWALVKSMVIYSDKHPLFAEFGGLHHVYANAEAMRALVKGGTFPDGSVLVLDLHEAKDENGAWSRAAASSSASWRRTAPASRRPAGGASRRSRATARRSGR